jgi:hypothetical protein
VGEVDMDDGTDAEQRRRVRQLEEHSYRQVQRDRHRAAAVQDRTAAGHERAARLHERLADLGWGDVEEHRERAGAHREDAEANRDAAGQLGPGDAAGSADDRPDPPAGPRSG